jgi:DNA-binding transcriptional ArsR family regulator
MKLSIQETVYKACAHEKRLEIVRLLKINKYLTVGQIATATNTSIQTVSKQLQILHHAHIAEKSKEGLEVFYSIKKPISPIVRAILGFL